MKNKKILFIFAHLDDESYSLSGFMSRLNSKKVNVLVFCDGRNEDNKISRIKTFTDIMNKYKFNYKILGYDDLKLEEVNTTELTAHIDDYINICKPEVVITNSSFDIHQDHKIVSNAVKITCRPERNKYVKELYEAKIIGSEIFSNSYFDTEIILTDDEYILKLENCTSYVTEKQPSFSRKEYLRTIYRQI